MNDYGYQKITLYSNAKYNYLAASATRLQQCDINKINALKDDPTWSDVPGAFLLANFDTNLVSNSGDDTEIKELRGWRIYRQKNNENIRQFVGEIGYSANGIEDYVCANQTSYTYYAYPIVANKIGQPIKTSEFKTDWWNYSLTGFKKNSFGDYEPYSTWLFDCNLTSTQVTQNLDITKFNTFSRVPKISKGKNNYQTMGITALLGGINYDKNDYEEGMDLLEAWQEFVGECDLCLWKDRKGAIKVGTIYDNPTAQYIDEVSKQPTQISFTFVETKDINDYAVFKAIEPYHVDGTSHSPTI